MNDARTGVTLVTAVWGDGYVDDFCRITARTLLSPENLPNATKRWDIDYLIITSHEDRDRLQSKSIWKVIEKLLPVRFILYPRAMFREGDPILLHTRMWKRAYENVRRRGRIMTFVAPDAVYSSGSLPGLIEPVADEGKKAMIGLGMQLRIVEETFLEEIHEDLDRGSCEPLDFQSSWLADQVVRHLHPLCASLMEGSPHFSYYQEYLFFPAGKKRFLMRLLLGEVVTFDTRRCRVDERFKCLETEDIAYADDTSRLTVASITSLYNYTSFYIRRGGPDAKAVGQWLYQSYSPVLLDIHRKRRSVRYECTDIEAKAEWKRAVINSDRFMGESMKHLAVNQTAACLAGDSRLWAALLMALYHRGILMDKLPEKRPFIFLAPRDEWLTDADRNQVAQLFTRNHWQTLEKFVLTHLLPIGVNVNESSGTFDLSIDEGDILSTKETGTEVKTLSGEGIFFQAGKEGLMAGDAKLLSASKLIAGCIQIVVIDRPACSPPAPSGVGEKISAALPHQPESSEETTSFREGDNCAEDPPPGSGEAKTKKLLESGRRFMALAALESVMKHYAESLEMLDDESYRPLAYFKTRGLQRFKEPGLIGKNGVLWTTLAGEAFQRACENDPEHFDAIFAKAEFLEETGRDDEALKTWPTLMKMKGKKALSEGRHAAAAWAGLRYARLCEKKNDFDNAMTGYAVALIRRGWWDWPAAHAGMGKCCLECEDWEEALYHFGQSFANLDDHGGFPKLTQTIVDNLSPCDIDDSKSKN